MAIFLIVHFVEHTALFSPFLPKKWGFSCFIFDALSLFGFYIELCLKFSTVPNIQIKY